MSEEEKSSPTEEGSSDSVSGRSISRSTGPGTPSETLLEPEAEAIQLVQSDTSNSKSKPNKNAVTTVALKQPFALSTLQEELKQKPTPEKKEVKNTESPKKEVKIFDTKESIQTERSQEPVALNDSRSSTQQDNTSLKIPDEKEGTQPESSKVAAALEDSRSSTQQDTEEQAGAALVETREYENLLAHVQPITSGQSPEETPQEEEVKETTLYHKPEEEVVEQKEVGETIETTEQTASSTIDVPEPTLEPPTS